MVNVVDLILCSAGHQSSNLRRQDVLSANKLDTENVVDAAKIRAVKSLETSRICGDISMFRI